ncbi:MAG TPA: PilZ domain-containing protein [Candidatus Methylomirabilis sp.]|nr:PilZ domain-containing protein [Candidatus Methylomirabilis sp.]
MSSAYSVPRRHARLTFSEPATGAVSTSHSVHILDLSLAGARLEHGVILRPGTRCNLRFRLAASVLTVNCRVVWSKVVGREAGGPGGTALTYHSGVQFDTLSRDAKAMLKAYLGTTGLAPPDGSYAE